MLQGVDASACCSSVSLLYNFTHIAPTLLPVLQLLLELEVQSPVGKQAIEEKLLILVRDAPLREESPRKSFSSTYQANNIIYLRISMHRYILFPLFLLVFYGVDVWLW